MKKILITALMLCSFAAQAGWFAEVSSQTYETNSLDINRDNVQLAVGVESDNFLFRGYFNGSLGADVGVQQRFGEFGVAAGVGAQQIQALDTINGISDKDTFGIVWIEASYGDVFARLNYTEADFTFTKVTVSDGRTVTSVSNATDDLYMLNVGIRF